MITQTVYTLPVGPGEAVSISADEVRITYRVMETQFRLVHARARPVSLDLQQ